MPFNPHWGSTKKRATHKYEYLIEAILNKQFYKFDLRAKRVKDDPFSPYDLGIYLFDYDRLTYGEEICKLDLERKPEDKFPTKDIPARWVRGVSFTERKIKKEINDDRDVYMLFDNREDYPKCIWIHYGDLRTYAHYKSYAGYKNDFLEIRNENKHLLHFDYKSFVNWCIKLKNQKIISDEEMYKTAGANALLKYGGRKL
jgi:hypothetical protein